MSIYQITKTDMVGYLNTLTGVTIPEADVTFSTSRPASAAEVTKWNRNSRCVVTFSSSSSIATGQGFLYYDRLDLAVLSKMVMVPRGAEPGTPLADLLQDVRAMTGIPFVASELEPTVLTTTEAGKSTLLLKAKADSLGWTGEFAVPFKDLDDITTAFKSNLLKLF